MLQCSARNVGNFRLSIVRCHEKGFSRPVKESPSIPYSRCCATPLLQQYSFYAPLSIFLLMVGVPRGSASIAGCRNDESMISVRIALRVGETRFSDRSIFNWKSAHRRRDKTRFETNRLVLRAVRGGLSIARNPRVNSSPRSCLSIPL